MSREKTKGERQLLIGAERWGFKVTSSSVTIFEPSRKRHNIDMSKWLGKSWDDIERAHWKGYGPDFLAVRPGEIRAYIDANLRHPVQTLAEVPKSTGKARVKKVKAAA